MPPADLLQALRKRPFEPFRLQISDGSTYAVPHPELVMVGMGSAIIGIPASGQTQLPYERYETVDLRHIVKMVPLTGAASGPGNGQAGS
jgi:hypothetical protein